MSFEKIEAVFSSLSRLLDMPPLPRRVLVPGLVLIAGYSVFTLVFAGTPGEQAFVTAFLLAMGVRIVLRFERTAGLLSGQFAGREGALLALATAFAPLLLIAFAADPLVCQRLQSAWCVIFGGMFLSDVVFGRATVTARFFPHPELAHLYPVLARGMVLICLAFVLVNEMLIASVEPSLWLLYWAVLPVLTHVMQSALVTAVADCDDSGATA